MSSTTTTTTTTSSLATHLTIIAFLFAATVYCVYKSRRIRHPKLSSPTSNPNPSLTASTGRAIRFDLIPSQLETDSKDDDGAIPPPEVKSMVAESARLIATLTPYSEQCVIKELAGRPKYSFLNVADPYHAYYQQQLSELRAQNGPVDDDYGMNKYYKFKKERKRLLYGIGNEITKFNFEERIAEIKKSRERDAERLREEVTVVSPLTGELILACDVYRHMQYTEHKEEKERLYAKIRDRETTHAQDDRISATIGRLAKTDSYVFRATEEELCNAVKAYIQGDPKYKSEVFVRIQKSTLSEDEIIALLRRKYSHLSGTSEEEKYANAPETNKIETA